MGVFGLGKPAQDPKEDALFLVNNERYEHKNAGKVPTYQKHMMWLTAYARFMAVILKAESTSKAAGLAAHQHVILQLHNESQSGL